MPPNNKLKSIERTYNEPASTLIPRLLREHGTPFRVAVVLGVYPNTIRHWLIKNGYRIVNGTWEKRDA